MAKRSASTSTRSRKAKPNAPAAAADTYRDDDLSHDAEGGSTGGGKHLVIVESPTKAKTINKYLGRGYQVLASVGHVRDLPERAPKGVKQPVPGVDIEHDFAPTYEVLANKKKTVGELKKAAKNAAEVWFATDLDREGEAIAWHLAETLNIKPSHAKRVVFNAITKSEITSAFNKPRPIDENKVNAQQARRILDRIVGYQVSPLLWRKVAGGLSAGRVQSVATRLVVDREREIEAFIPDEFWKVTGYFATDLAATPKLRQAWFEFLQSASGNHAAVNASGDETQPTVADEAEGSADATGAADQPSAAVKGRTLKEKLAWLSSHKCIRAELIEVNGQPAELTDRDAALQVSKRLGLVLGELKEWQDPKGKGPARFLALVIAKPELSPDVPRFVVQSLQTRRTTSRPPGPFITSTLQQAAANQLGFALQRTMRIAQQLYEGIDLGADLGGSTGLITYMRTDSTHISGEALSMVRAYINSQLGEKYLPEKPNFFSSSNKDAQEAHEAIRPTDVTLTPQRVRHALSEEQFKLYHLIWKRFVACQMTHAQWDATTVLISALSRDNAHLAKFKANGRTLVFDGFYKVAGIPGAGGGNADDAVLPPLAEQQQLGPLQVDPVQGFTSPPPRFTEASLQKKLEEEGIGRPSTYAAIISTIQDRKYVEQVAPGDRRLRATDLGKVVTDKLIEGFPEIMDLAYTRSMESELDKIEDEHHDWVTMLKQFYGPFKSRLDNAHESMTHAKAQTEPAPHMCPTCGAATVYRFGKKGRFLSCSRYPDCKFASPIDAEGNPITAQSTDIACPLCGSAMLKRDGRFGPFLSCSAYPTCKGIVKLDRKKGTVVAPKVPPLTIDLPCPKCDSPLNLRRSKRGPWLSCSKYPRCRGRLAWSAIEEPKQKELDKTLTAHEHANPQPDIHKLDGTVAPDGYTPRIMNATPPVKQSA